VQTSDPDRFTGLNYADCRRTGPAGHYPPDHIPAEATPEDPNTVLADLGVGVSSANPGELVNQIARAFEAGDLAKIGRLIGKDALDPATLARLKAFAPGPLRLRQPDGFHEVGELEMNTRTRWALELDGREPGRDRIFLDLRRIDGKWRVEKLTFPPDPDQPPA